MNDNIAMEHSKRFEFIDQLGDGGFADVWRARDHKLDRDVAVKIVRPAAAPVADALKHARALARVRHPNVVIVHSVETVIDPVGQQPVDGVVMELLEGDTLETRLAGERFTVDDAVRICTGIVDGLEKIHAEGLVHYDLHTGNVMVCPREVKIIDILYRDTLALLSTASRESRVRADLRNLRIMIISILGHCPVTSSRLGALNSELALEASIPDLRQLLHRTAEDGSPEDRQRGIDLAYQRIIDTGFVNEQEYADALAEDTDPADIGPLIRRLIEEKTARDEHTLYIRKIWGQLPATDQAEVLQLLSMSIEKETPKGNWAPLLRVLFAFGASGWKGLSQVCRIRLEKMILNDILAGRKPAYGVRLTSSGSLGTWAKKFWRYFRDRDVLIDNIVRMLHESWDTQNYIGIHFLRLMPHLADTPERKQKLIEGLKSAIRNDAHLLKGKLGELPSDWVEQIKCRLDPGPGQSL